MKHTPEQLLLAASVRDRAFALRNAATPADLEGDALSEWRRSQDMRPWLEKALQELETVATIIFKTPT